MISPEETVIEIDSLDRKIVKLVGENVSVFYKTYDNKVSLIIGPVHFNNIVYQDNDSIVFHIVNNRYLIVANMVEFFHADTIQRVNHIEDDDYVVNNENTITAFVAGYSFIIDVPTFFCQKDSENIDKWMDDAYLEFCRHEIIDDENILDDIAETNGIIDVVCEISNLIEIDPNNDGQSKYIQFIKEYCANIGIITEPERQRHQLGIATKGSE